MVIGISVHEGVFPSPSYECCCGPFRSLECSLGGYDDRIAVTCLGVIGYSKLHCAVRAGGGGGYLTRGAKVDVRSEWK